MCGLLLAIAVILAVAVVYPPLVIGVGALLIVLGLFYAVFALGRADEPD